MGIIVYTTPTCAWCHKLKIFLNKKKVQFEERDLTEEKHARKEVLEKSGQFGVPVTDIDGEIIVGFDKKALEKALSKKK